MAQLKMYWRMQQAAFPLLPPEFSCRSMEATPEDVAHWVQICKNGLLADEDDAQSFANRMFGQEGFTYDSVLFLQQHGTPVATATAIVRPGGDLGYLHMVSVDCSVRGRGMGTLLNSIALARFAQKGVKGAYLTTDEWRIPAVKSYLRAGFLPVQYDAGMSERWEMWLREQGYGQTEMVDEDGNFVQWLLEA